jgi:hypothetical protein
VYCFGEILFTLILEAEFMLKRPTLYIIWVLDIKLLKTLIEKSLYLKRNLFLFPSDGIHYLNNEGLQPIVFNNAVLPSANITKHRVHSLWVVSNYECFKLSAGKGVVLLR